MRRRQFLATTALLGAATFAGCNRRESVTPPPTPTVPDGVTAWRFEQRKETDQDPDEPPTIHCFPDNGRVFASGTMPSGNDCSTLYPATVAWDGGEFRLVVDVHAYRDHCNDILNIREYEAEVHLANGLPDTVRVVEAMSTDGGTRSATERCP